MKTKKCSKCGIEQPLDDYHFRRRNGVGDGFRATCRTCDGHKYAPKEYLPKGFKRCCKCNRILPLNEYHFLRDSHVKDGFRGYCKECMNMKFTKPKEILPKGYKRCSMCGEIFPETTEYFNIKRGNKLNARCVFCLRKYGIEYWNKYKDKHSEQSKANYIKNKDKILKRMSERGKTFKGKMKNRIQYLRRRNLNNKALSSFTLNDWEECLKFFNYKDAYTGLPMNVISQDHVIPLSKGGAYFRQNIVPCERSINSSKGNKDMEKWFKKQNFYSEERLEKIHEWMGIKDNKQQLSII